MSANPSVSQLPSQPLPMAFEGAALAGQKGYGKGGPYGEQLPRRPRVGGYGRDPSNEPPSNTFCPHCGVRLQLTAHPNAMPPQEWTRAEWEASMLSGGV